MVSTRKLGASKQITVSGYSLGGFLAQAFAAKHDAVVTAAYTYNAPGFNGQVPVGGIGTELLKFFGITNAAMPNGKIFNVRAADGLSATAGLGQMIGSIDTFNIEKGDIVNNHSIVTLSDTLAVQAVLAKLSPTLTQGDSNKLVQAASNQHPNTLEFLLDAVRRQVGGQDVIPTPIGNRDSLYANLKALSDSPASSALAGELLIRPANADLRVVARNDFGALIALQDLSPLYLSGTTAALQAQLNEIWQTSRASDYTAWLADKSAISPTTFTDSWIKDRAALLQAIVTRNKQNNTTGLVYDPAAPAGQATLFQWNGAEPLTGETRAGLATLLTQNSAVAG